MKSSQLPDDENWLLGHADFIMESLPSTPRILELGCGRGRDTSNLLRFGEVVAVDVSAEALQLLARNHHTPQLAQMDISAPWPFADNYFHFLLASLSIHYFTWRETEFIISEMRRCLTPKARAIVRVNSTNDTNYGADSTDQIEPLFYRVGDQKKRFFDRQSIDALFSDWHMEHIAEKVINRYAKEKCVWEVLLKRA